jgi:A/G-specific adenine glycosylase
MASSSSLKERHSSRFARKAELRVLWSSKICAGSAKPAAGLRKFFVRFAKENLRALPWRASGVSPFHLLLAEVLLVQTKAEDVAFVWPKLIRKYPTPAALSRAKKRSLTTLLRPLGLQNQRAKSLVSIARTLSLKFAGRVPRSFDELLSIPHVGLYTAAAAVCFAFGEPVPIVDANVLRVLGRIHGVKFGADLRRAPDAWSLAWSILPRKDPKLHNYALLDFAARICTVRGPLCNTCALRHTCQFGQDYLAIRYRS